VQSGLRKSDNNDGKPVVINEKEKETQEKGKGKKEEKRRKTSWLTISETS
jgi:hypothetical protein